MSKNVQVVVDRLLSLRGRMTKQSKIKQINNLSNIFFILLNYTIMNTIIDTLQRRYATKKFDPNKKLQQSDIDTLLEVMRLSPSSFGLQPWRFIHVSDPAIREQLKANSRGQPQVTDASDLLIIATKTNVQEDEIDEYLQSIIDKGGKKKILKD